jgi:hypothetical protein
MVGIEKEGNMTARFGHGTVGIFHGECFNDEGTETYGLIGLHTLPEAHGVGEKITYDQMIKDLESGVAREVLNTDDLPMALIFANPKSVDVFIEELLSMKEKVFGKGE